MGKILQILGAIVAILGFMLAFFFGITHIDQLIDSNGPKQPDASNEITHQPEEPSHKEIEPVEPPEDQRKDDTVNRKETESAITGSNRDKTDRSRLTTRVINHPSKGADVSCTQVWDTTIITLGTDDLDDDQIDRLDDFLEQFDVLETGGNVTVVETSLPELPDILKARVMYALGRHYEDKGEYGKAIKQLHEALVSGCPNSAERLDRIYVRGKGVEKDYRKAFSYFKEAALSGDSWSMYILGLAYEYGRGVDKNLDKAEQLYDKAAQLGNEEAAERLREIR